MIGHFFYTTLMVNYKLWWQGSIKTEVWKVLETRASHLQ